MTHVAHSEDTLHLSEAQCTYMVPGNRELSCIFPNVATSTEWASLVKN